MWDGVKYPKMANKKRVVITGGHLTPAIAVISELQKEGDWEVYFLGRRYATEGEKAISVESQIIPSLGIKFFPITVGRLQRRFTRHTIPSLLRVPLGFFQSLKLLLQIKPQVICSFGGYVSVPVVFAGWLLKIPILTHEQTVVFGLASKINAFFVNKVAVSFPESVKYFPKNKVVLTGNPIREEIFQIKKPSWFSGEAKSRSAGPVISAKGGSASGGQLSNYPIIYVTGGNQGSHTINMAVLEILLILLEKHVVIHQTGEKDYQQITDDRLQITQSLRKRYFIVPYIGPEEIGWVLNKASLIVSRAGANVISEIAVLGKPALFIPIPWAYQDEQTKNAQILVNAGVAEILSQAELSGMTLLYKISQMIEGLEKYKKRASAVKKLAASGAALKIAEILHGLAKKA